MQGGCSAYLAVRLLAYRYPFNLFACTVCAIAVQLVASVGVLAFGYLYWLLFLAHSVTYIHTQRALKNLSVLVCTVFVILHLGLNVPKQIHLLNLCQPFHLLHAKQQLAS